MLHIVSYGIKHTVQTKYQLCQRYQAPSTESSSRSSVAEPTIAAVFGISCCLLREQGVELIPQPPLVSPSHLSPRTSRSGCGWPAFDKCFKGSVVTETDNAYGMRRVEIMCGSCGGHLGHVVSCCRYADIGNRFFVSSFFSMHGF